MNTKPQTKPVRCAVYTRKSTEEGLEQEYNSLDAQRDAAEAYVASQKHDRVTKPLTINRSFHVQTRRNGSKKLADGKASTKPAGRVARIARLLALAHHCRKLIRDGVIINQSELAHYGQISTTRMSQIMWLDNLAPDIQEAILDLPRTVCGRDPILERDLRPIAKTHDWKEQREMWSGLRRRAAVNPD